VEQRKMIKIFQGAFQTVQNDINQWIEVYNPQIVDFKQSMVLMEHTLVILITILYEEGREKSKVSYVLDKFKK
jgi:hypothetical protein